jgi:hypothetical protein
MDYVYVCRSGENEELRYSIRSLVKNLPDVNVWIIGDAPKWYTGNIVYTPSIGQKYTIVRSNLQALTETDDIGEHFVLMNDDFFVMKPMGAIETWHGGTLWEAYKRRSQLEPYSTYTQFLLQTYKTIKHLGIKDPINYELHTPLPMTKSALSYAVGQPGLWRSITANRDNIGGTQHEDVKLYLPSSKMYQERNDLDNLAYLSSDDGTFEILLTKYLEDAFPDPSPYER